MTTGRGRVPGSGRAKGTPNRKTLLGKDFVDTLMPAAISFAALVRGEIDDGFRILFNRQLETLDHIIIP